MIIENFNFLNIVIILYVLITIYFLISNKIFYKKLHLKVRNSIFEYLFISIFWPVEIIKRSILYRKLTIKESEKVDKFMEAVYNEYMNSKGSGEN